MEIKLNQDFPRYNLLNKFINETQLIVHGQGTLLFRPFISEESCQFDILDNNKQNGLRFTLTTNNINILKINTINPNSNTNIYKYKFDSQNISIIPQSYYWFSLDSQNQSLKFGVGEARLDTEVFNYIFENTSEEEYESNKKFLESLTTLDNLQNILPKKILRDPIVNPVPLKVLDTNQLTMDDIAQYKYLPHSNLSSTAQILYDCISGRKFVLDDADFPDFSKAIEYSIATNGCWCHKKLKEKSTEFNKDKPNINETYLRITLGRNSGESPGIPYVMEIWPSNHYSPVHSHADTDAIIRVLHGSINVKLFPFLSSDPSSNITYFSQANFNKDDITWISPELNQIHQLTNINQDATCITIQCYMYGKKNTIHYDYFDYIDDTGKIQQYEPDSDMDFVEFKQLMKKEWNNRKKAEKVKHCLSWLFGK